MAAHRDESHAGSDLHADHNTANRGRSGLAEAVTGLRRLTQDLRFEDIERVLAIPGSALRGNDVSVETLRALRNWGAEHLRVADELEAAARCCRLVEREIGERVDALLAGWETEPVQAGRDRGALSAGAVQRGGLDGWLRGVFRRGRTGSQPSGDRLLPSRRAGRHRRARTDASPAATGDLAALQHPSPDLDPAVVPLLPSIPKAQAVTSPATPLGLSWAANQRAEKTGLTAYLLGPLCVAINDVLVEDWPSARCRSLFGYLLTHREPWPPRELLMELFWPESSPEASRNSLNVAIHGLRRALRTATVVPVILHSGGAYRIHPDLSLWLDVEEFESRLEHGRRHEKAGNDGRATQEYESADGLYRGDFLAEDLYEEWAALTRERLRLAHLDALSRLSHLHFGNGQYAACAALCQRIIERDPCREDAHRRLMRCYSRQGQPHLALLQYRACVRALAEELDVAADPATATLYDQIRRHEPV